MQDLGESAPLWWPVGRVGAVMTVAAALLVAGGIVAVVAGPASSSQARVAVEPVADPIGPSEPRALPAVEVFPEKAAPEHPELSTDYVPPKTTSRSGGSSSGGSSSGGSSGGGSSTGSGVLGLTNQHRAANGLGALSSNAALTSASCAWAEQLASQDSGLSHSSFPGGFSSWGENVYYSSWKSSSSDAVTAWMNSAGHRANILNGGFTMMGSCSADSASGKRYWVQQFGS